MGTALSYTGIVFDAYGTLFDVHAVETALERRFVGKGRAISSRWRDKQIEYSRLRTMSGRYADFWSVTVDALDYACEFERAALTEDARSELLALYRRLPPHADVPEALRSIAALGAPLGVLSNANRAMLEAALDAAKFRGMFAHVLSVESVRRFKTAPEAYQLGPEAFGRSASELLFVSSNGWDAAGAAWFGHPAYWINRYDAPRERLDAPLAGVGRTMLDLADFLGKAR